MFGGDGQMIFDRVISEVGWDIHPHHRVDYDSSDEIQYTCTCVSLSTKCKYTVMNMLISEKVFQPFSLFLLVSVRYDLNSKSYHLGYQFMR